eukprot:TRINITY_DN7743_c0_g1_i4.p1 TRINITY_DN7743_c0_g1~~TRINITY_DN7743_c0_g1_i4.p1  ORF type:complete len:292 (+),score=47.21 TRINITY_DN7743_c0_g1_i4:117-992(+)
MCIRDRLQEKRDNIEYRRQQFDERREQMHLERERRKEEFEKRMESINQRREERFQNSKRRLLADDNSDEAILERLEYDQFNRFKQMKEDFQNLDNLTAEEKVKNQSELLETFLNTQREQDQIRNEAMIRLQNKQRGDRGVHQDREPMSEYEQEEYQLARQQQRILEEDRRTRKMDDIVSNLEEQQQSILSQFKVVIWGNQHPFLSHWITQLANYAPNGVSFSPQLEKQAVQLGFELEEFNKAGVDLNNEIFFTGYIQFEEKLKNIDEKHMATKYQPYIACGQLQVEQKMDL